MEEQQDIPQNWCRVALNDVADIGAGNPAPQGRKYFSGNGPPFVRVQDMGKLNGAKYIQDTKDRLSESGAGSLKLFPKGTVLFTKSGASTLLNQRAIIAQDSYIVSHIGTAFPASGILSEWLYYFLTTVDFVKYAHGANMPSMPLSKAKEIPFPIASTDEQKRIVVKIEELFSELDKGVESLKTAREQLKVYRQAVLKHAFEGKLTEAWREEHKDNLETADELLERIKKEREAAYQQQLVEWQAAVKKWEQHGKDGKKPAKPSNPEEIIPLHENDFSKLAPLPHGWTWIRVRGLCDVVRGGSPRPAGDPKYYDGDIPFLKVADITRTPGAFLNTYSYTIKKAGLQKTRKVAANTLLLSNSGATLGVPKICLIEATFNDGIAAFLGLNKEHLLYHYYFWTNKTKELRAINQGAAQPNLNTDLIKEIIIPVSSPEEMTEVTKEIEEKLSVCDQIDEEIQNNLQKTEALRQSILKQAFSGKLVRQYPDDEPASKLLERIKAEKNQTENKKRKVA